MLASRVIVCLDVKDGRIVKGVNFLGLRDAGCPIEASGRYDAQGADEIVFLDITATVEGRRSMLNVVARAADETSCPLTVGGGVGAVSDVEALLRAGADKVSINSAAVKNLAVVTRCADRWGSQAIVVAIDAKRRPDGSGFEVFIAGGRTATGLDAVVWAETVVRAGAGEILLTSMDRDGTRQGFDLELTRLVADAVSVPVIASGGVGTLEHLVAGFREGHASAVLAASIFHDGQFTIGEAKTALEAAGLPVRHVIAA